MKILFLTTAFNGLAQRAWIELDRLNHQVKVQIATDAVVMETAVADFQPELIIAPFLKKRIPASIWENHVCLVVHPGIIGDRGSSSLDWAILNGEKEWGVTILQAVEKMDAGAVWASHNFPMREASKSCLYRHEVTQAAMKGLLEAVANFQSATFQPRILDDADPAIEGGWKRRTQPADFQFSWQDNSKDILRKINAADSDSGVLIELFGEVFLAYGGHLEESLVGPPGQILAKRNKAICIATSDQALW